MGKLNLLVYLNAYKDPNASNNPSLNSYKWSRELQGLSADKPESIEFSLAPGESKTLFNGQRTLSSDSTTQLSVTPKPGSLKTYRLTHTSGTAPNFRTPRVSGADNTTEVDVTVNSNLVTFTSSSGTPFSLTTVLVGDEVVIGPVFASQNRGKFKVLAKTSTSFTVENPQGIAEIGVDLGATFEDEVRFFSSSGVQVGDKLSLGTGFNDIVKGTYQITYVQDNFIEFFSAKTLPENLNVLNGNVFIYSTAKRVVYLESDKKVNLEVNSIQESPLEPFIDATASLPGIFLKRSTVWSLIVTNNGTDIATLYFASAE